MCDAPKKENSVGAVGLDGARQDAGPTAAARYEGSPSALTETRLRLRWETCMTHSIPLEMPLTTPTSATTTLGEALTHQLTIVQLVRYFGSLPCQEWLVELEHRRPDPT